VESCRLSFLPRRCRSARVSRRTTLLKSWFGLVVVLLRWSGSSPRATSCVRQVLQIGHGGSEVGLAVYAAMGICVFSAPAALPCSGSTLRRAIRCRSRSPAPGSAAGCSPPLGKIRMTCVRRFSSWLRRSSPAAAGCSPLCGSHEEPAPHDLAMGRETAPRDPYGRSPSLRSGLRPCGKPPPIPGRGGSILYDR